MVTITIKQIEMDKMIATKAPVLIVASSDVLLIHLGTSVPS